MQHTILYCIVPFMKGVSIEDNYRLALEAINRRIEVDKGEAVNIETITVSTLFWARPVGLRLWYRKSLAD